MRRRKMMSRKRSLRALAEQWFSSESVATATAYEIPLHAAQAPAICPHRSNATCRHAEPPFRHDNGMRCVFPPDPRQLPWMFQEVQCTPQRGSGRSSLYSRVLLIAVVRSDDLVAHSDDCSSTRARHLIPVGDAGADKRTVREIAERVELRRFECIELRRAFVSVQSRYALLPAPLAQSPSYQLSSSNHSGLGHTLYRKSVSEKKRRRRKS
ncbi:hypothetical protein OKW43_006481 [Paraburkholderia sp. WC7.3g]